MTGYKRITTLHTKLRYLGGFCKWWYLPVEDVLTWPTVDPQTQYLATEPVLKTGKSWFGPVSVPDKQLGFEESQETTKAGLYYKLKVEGVHPGDNGPSRVNLENMPYHKYIIVGKQRAGGLYLLIGGEENPLDFDANYTTGHGVNYETAGSTFAFTGESLNKAMVLTAFLGENVVPPVTGEDGGTSGLQNDNETEIIWFYNVSTVSFAWSDSRKERFGIFPEVQVWFIDAEVNGGEPYLANVIIGCDAAPPDTTVFTINNSGPATGFIVLK